jgi:hypothetical protein
MARWLFHTSIHASVDFMRLTNTELHSDWTINRLCTTWNVDCTEPALAHYKDVPLGSLKDEHIAFETCRWARVALAKPMLTYYETIHNYDAFTREKLERFVNHHLTGYATGLGMSPYPDDLSFATRSTERVVLKRRPLEELERLGFDLKEVHPTLLARYIKCEASDEWLEDTFGELFSPLVYHPLRTQMVSVDVIRAHSTYCACVYICQLMTEHASADEASFQAYHLAFVDFFYHCLGGLMSDDHLWARYKNSKQSPWVRWFPWDTRGFVGDDLPNYMHLLWQIPMRGEVDVEQFPLMKFIIKCMPFACQRRSMMKLVVSLCETNDAFWRFFSKCMWCLLAAAYPGDVPIVNMFQLLRAKQLCDNRSLLLKALARTDALERVKADTTLTDRQRRDMLQQIKKEQESNCLVVVTAVRKYIIHMVSRYNAHYAPDTIDWPTFEQETNSMAARIRQSNTFIDDAFQETRVQLARSNKMKERTVYRFRKHSCAKTLYIEFQDIISKDFVGSALPNFRSDMDLMVRLLEMSADDARMYARPNKAFGALVQSAENVHKTLRQLLQHWQDTVAYMEYKLTVHVKERILNLVFNMPKHMRMSMEGIASVLRVVGGARVKTIALVMLLIRLYHDNALPKTTRTYLGEIHTKDFHVLSWYFCVVAHLEQLDFAPVTLERIEQIDEAMVTVRHPLYPGQTLNPVVYNVLWKLCCSELATLCGKRAYGHKDVAYNLHTRQLVCNAKIKDVVADPEQMIIETSETREEDDEEEDGGGDKGTRQTPNNAALLPCKEQSVLSIPLRSCMLVVKPKGNAAKTFRYTRCRLCACVHKFDMLRDMVCLDCAREDLTRHESGSWTMVYQCSYCHSGGAFGHRAGQTSRPRVRPTDVLIVHNPPPPPSMDDDDLTWLDPEEQFQVLRFCHRCHQLAVRYVNLLTKDKLFAKIQKKILEQTKNAANGVYKH